MFDRDAFEERAAIMEFDGGLSRFKAETLAAGLQGLTRWNVMKEIRDEERKRNSAGRWDNGPKMGREWSSLPMPGVQPAPEKEE